MNQAAIAARVAALPPDKQRQLVRKMVEQGISLGTLPLVAQPDLPTAPLSAAQQRLWIFDQMNPDVAAYNLAFTVRLTGMIDRTRLQAAVDALVARHSVLRTVFEMDENGDPQQRLLAQVKMPLTIVEPEAGAWLAEEAVTAELTAFVQRSFDLSSGPLMRVLLLHDSAESHILQFVVHHIITDGVSLNLMLFELMQLYETAAAAQPEVQYADYARWQQLLIDAGGMDSDLAYWKEQLAELPTYLPLPTDFTRPAQQSMRGSFEPFHIDAALTSALTTFARQQGCTLYTVLLTGFKILLARYAGSHDIVVGSPSSGRTHAQTQDMLGFFVNNLVLRSDLSGNPSSIELLKRVQSTVLDAQAHEAVPFSKLIEAVNPVRDARYSPLFQAMLILQPPQRLQMQQRELAAELLAVDSQTAQFDIRLNMIETAGTISCQWEYCSDLFRQETVTQMIAHFQTILSGMVTVPNCGIEQLPLLSEQEIEQVIHGWNATQTDYPTDVSMVTLFEQQVDRTPDQIALRFGKTALTYAQMDERVNQLAHLLRVRGVSAETLVAVCMDRSIEMVLALYAILKAGGAYVPIDPTYPAQRISHMIEDAEPLLILTQQHLAHLFADIETAVLALDGDADLLPHYPSTRPNIAIDPSSAMYAIFTSGSTGRPKGVLNEHRALVNRLLWMQETFQLGADDVVLQKTPFSFDVSVWEFFWPLLTGASLVVLEPEAHKDPQALIDAIRSNVITTLHFVPSMLQLFLTNDTVVACTSLRRVICSGEALPIDAVRRFAELNSAEIHNLYGPTEAAIDVSWWHCQPEADRVPIGKPIANTQLYILDQFHQPVPKGVAGELYIGGIQVAREYVKRPSLTAERFITLGNNQLGLDPATRLYKTGDLCRHLPDGNIDYLGRLDHQIKLHGLRVELGEIESALLTFDGIREAVVLARQDDGTHMRLVAYLVADTKAPVDSTSLRVALAQTLPQHMVPAAFVLLDAMPLSPNGKVARSALPAPTAFGEQDESVYVAPRTPVEEQLQAAWEQFLHLDSIGVYDDFFALGGDSLVAIRLVSHIQSQLGYRLTVPQMLRGATIADSAEIIAATQQAQPDLDPAQPVRPWELGPFPLGINQRWVVENDPVHHQMNMALMLDMPADLDKSALVASVQHWFDSYHMLRVHLVPHEQDGFMQQIAAPFPAPLDLIDLSRELDQDLPRKIEVIANAMQESLDMHRGPMTRLAYFDLGRQRTGRLLVIINHFVCDRITFDNLVRHLIITYTCYQRNDPLPLPPSATYFWDWLNRSREWADSAEVRATVDDWRSLYDKPFRPLPIDLEHDDDLVIDKREVRTLLDSAETEAILRYAKAAQVNIVSMLGGAFMHALRAWTGNPHQLIGVVTHGRRNDLQAFDLANSVGWYGHTHPYAFDISGCTTVEEAIAATGQQYSAMPHGGFDYQLLTFLSSDPALRVEMEQLAVPQIELNFIGDFRGLLSQQEIANIGLDVALSNDSYGATHHPRSVRRFQLICDAVITRNGELSISINYNQRRHKRETIQALFNAITDGLKAAASVDVETVSMLHTPLNAG